MLLLSAASATRNVIYVQSAGDWTSIATAIATILMAFFTLLLVVGVAIAAMQLFQDRRFNQGVQTSALISDWNAPALRSFRRMLDHSADYADNKYRAELMYHAQHGQDSRWNDFIEDTADLTERIWLYVQKGLADREMIFEHLGYDIVSTYYHVQRILQIRTHEDDMLYDSFRSLVIATQEYSRQHPSRLDLREVLRDATFPELVSKMDANPST